MKPFRERNPIIIGAITVTTIVALILGAWKFTTILGYFTSTTYSAYFDEAGGLTTGAPVRVSGFQAGQVQSIGLEPNGVLITFTVADGIRLGENTEAAIKTISLLGTKVLDITPRGPGQLSDTIPMNRTTSPYQLPDAVGDLTATISGLNTHQLSQSLQTLSQTLQDTPPQLKLAVDGVARFSQTLNERDAQLRGLLANARRATTVLAERTNQIVGLIHDTNAVLAALRSQSAALDQISGNISALTQQIHGFIGENRSTLTPALEKLNGVLATLDNRKTEIQKSIKGLDTYAMSLGEALSSGPFFKAYVANLLPGQFVQPFVDAAFSDLGLDPNVLLPSQRTDPQTGQPGTPALPVPYPRTGQGGEPRLTLPDAITGKPGDEPCGPPGVALPGQFVQPFVDAAFSDLGLDPNVLLPSQRTDPQTGQAGTPALPVPYPRTGQGGEPHLTLPDAITGKPGDEPCGPPGVALPGPGCYPYREPLPAPPPGGPPPGPPALPPGQSAPAEPTPMPIFVPAPGEPNPGAAQPTPTEARR